MRLELSAGGTRIDLHWPLSHSRELAALVRDPPLQLKREEVALCMSAEEIHDDVHEFIGKLQRMTGVA